MIAGPLYLTILRYGDTVAMDLAEVDPVVPRSQIQIEERLLTEINEELARITTLANKETALQGSKAPTRVDLSRSALGALQRLGGLIYSHLFPAPARRRLAEIGSTDVFLRLDDQLVHVPWELAFDGRDFLLSKFRIGRQVISQQPPMLRSPREVKYRARLKMLIVVDPTESLPNAVEEADQICELLEACDNLEVSVISGKQLRKIDLLQALNECDVVHYAGHAVFDPQQPNNSGWVLHDAVLTASEISRVPHPPFLVFSNACQAGATTRWQPDAIYQGQAFGIGSAFLLAGTQNYIGTFCVIYDAYSAAFAANFYRHLLQGERLGAALSAARRGAGHDAGRNGLLWASYVHYGNPTFGLPLAPTTGVSALDRWPHAMPDPALEMAASAIDECAPPPRGTGDLEAPGQAHQSAESRRASTRDTPLPSHESTGSEAQVRREGRRAHARSRWLALGTTVLLGLIVIATIW